MKRLALLALLLVASSAWAAEVVNVHGTSGSYNGHANLVTKAISVTGGSGMANGTYHVTYASSNGGGAFDITFTIASGHVAGFSPAYFVVGGNRSLSGTGSDALVSTFMPVASGTTWNWTGSPKTGETFTVAAPAVALQRIDSYSDGVATNDSKVLTTLVVPVGAAPNTASFSGTITSNCATQHALGLTINGVQVSYQVTSAFATRNAPASVTLSYSCTSDTIDCADGKPWILSVDGAPTESGTISYASGNYTHALANSPILFDCAPKAGALSVSGTLSNPGGKAGHTFSVRVAGSVAAVVVTTAGQTSLNLSQTVQGVENGAKIEWMIDGTVVATHFAAINCSYNAELGTTTCGGTDSYSGSVSDANPTPAPTVAPTPTTPPVQTPPPNFTPPPNSTPPQGPLPNPSASASSKQDFYDAVKAAVNDSGYMPTVAGVGDGTTVSEDRGKLDDLTNQGDAINSSKKRIEGFQSKIGSFLGGFEGETSLGQRYTITSGEITVAGTSFGTINWDLNKFRGWVDTLRLIFLWIMTIGFFMLYVGAIRDFVYGGK